MRIFTKNGKYALGYSYNRKNGKNVQLFMMSCETDIALGERQDETFACHFEFDRQSIDPETGEFYITFGVRGTIYYVCINALAYYIPEDDEALDTDPEGYVTDLDMYVLTCRYYVAREEEYRNDMTFYTENNELSCKSMKRLTVPLCHSELEDTGKMGAIVLSEIKSSSSRTLVVSMQPVIHS